MSAARVPGIFGRMAAVLQEFANLVAGERGLWAQCWIEGVEVKQKEVVAVLTPPLSGLGFLPTSSAHRGRKPQVPELRIRMEYDLVPYYRSGGRGDTAAYAESTGARYTLAPRSSSAT